MTIFISLTTLSLQFFACGSVHDQTELYLWLMTDWLLGSRHCRPLYLYLNTMNWKNQPWTMHYMNHKNFFIRWWNRLCLNTKWMMRGALPSTGSRHVVNPMTSQSGNFLLGIQISAPILIFFFFIANLILFKVMTLIQYIRVLASHNNERYAEVRACT